MKLHTKEVVILATIVGCLVSAGVATAEPIKAISADFLSSSFDNSSGTFLIGILTVDDNADIVVEYVSSAQTVFAGGHVNLTTSLFQDISAGGIADGLFVGGSITLTDNTLTPLLTANIVSMEVKELADQEDFLAGYGTFTVTGGTLAPDFGAMGQVYELTFNLSPNGIQNFTDGGGFGLSDLKLTPVPEPASCLLFATAGLSALGWMRRRSMTR